MLNKIRFEIIVEGRVQGVGFRPFAMRIAQKFSLNGFVMNTSRGVRLEIEGHEKNCDNFVSYLKNKIKSPAKIDRLMINKLDYFGYEEFSILKSLNTDPFNLSIAPDLAICHDCIEEIFSPQERRYLYPFTNCMRCGPRYSILKELPYDRQNTTMKNFNMCSACLNEYEDINNRRFHAQPIACPKCGPEVFLTDPSHQILARQSEAISLAVSFLKSGKILALKGIGGFHLIADAHNLESITELRRRKNRPTKPFAIMFENIHQIKHHCEINLFEKKILKSQEAPIVLLKKKNHLLPNIIAPNNTEWGCLLPYSGLHYLLIKEFGHPLIITSANGDSDPLVYNNSEAIERLSQIADYFLMHNRDIYNPIDDSVLRVVHQSPMMIRKARGYAPSFFFLNEKFKNVNGNALSLGSFLKNTFCLKNGDSLIQSHHIGDLKSPLSRNLIARNIESLTHLLKMNPNTILLDSNLDLSLDQFGSDFLDTLRSHSQIININHHEAHIFSVVAEHNLSAPFLGFAWDGLGIGPQGEMRGGETYLAQNSQIKHVATLYPMPMIGGDKSSKEPRLISLGLLWTIYGDSIWEMDYFLKNKLFSERELSIYKNMMNSKNIKFSSSMGRLFDGVSSILNLCQLNSYEGEAAQILESSMPSPVPKSIHKLNTKGFEFTTNSQVFQIDWRILVKQLFESFQNGVEPRFLSQIFHESLVKILIDCAQHFKIEKIVLSGGCFQNRFLIENGVRSLKENGFDVYWNQTTPTNDGGISLGQWARYVFSHTR